jgi:integrase
MKTGAGLSVATLQRYSIDLKTLNLDLSTSNIEQIRRRLADLSTSHQSGSLRHMVTIAKQVLKELDREDVAERIPLPKRSEPRVVVYPKVDIDAILKGCSNLRDRLLIEILVETGARRGELYNMTIKDVQFDEHSPIVYLHGKTGTRARRVFNVGPDLISYLSLHPERNNPEAKFWIALDKGNKPLQYQGIYKIVRKLGFRALRRPIFPHGLRHTAATQDVKNFTDREMMIRYGWSNADMVGVYAHLSARDVDEKDLILHGFNTRTCPKCRNKARPTANYCENCGQDLQREGTARAKKKMRRLSPTREPQR